MAERARTYSVGFKRLPSNPDLPLPDRGTPGAAGYDLRSAEPEIELAPGEVRAVGTGLAMSLPEGLEAQIRPRSGLALKHALTMPNAPGTIDPDYRGELRVVLQNLGSDPVRLGRGERIAQMVFARFESPCFSEMDSLGRTERGDGGFGSTGRS